jgi:enoyl-[acyl-carrier protein] reductase I
MDAAVARETGIRHALDQPLLCNGEVIENCGIMRPRGIRVHAISPGPLATHAASGIPGFDALMERVAERAPARRLVTIEEVGAACVFLASRYAGAMTGDTIYIDGGYHILG